MKLLIKAAYLLFLLPVLCCSQDGYLIGYEKVAALPSSGYTYQRVIYLDTLRVWYSDKWNNDVFNITSLFHKDSVGLYGNPNAVLTNDSRLSDVRTPTAHTH